MCLFLLTEIFASTSKLFQFTENAEYAATTGLLNINKFKYY